jgi:hypothetical protein
MDLFDYMCLQGNVPKVVNLLQLVQGRKRSDIMWTRLGEFCKAENSQWVTNTESKNFWGGFLVFMNHIYRFLRT